jgi:alpha-amylase
MRAATFAHLIAAEDAADTALGSLCASELRDLDLDGRDEVRLATEGATVMIDLDEGGGIGSWDLRAARHALAGVLRRRPEAYHETLRAHEVDDEAKPDAEPGAGADADPDAPASIHERIQVKEPGLAAHLVYDDYERRSGLVRILPPDMTPERWAAGGRDELGDFVDGPFRLVRLDPDGAVLARAGRATIDGAPMAFTVGKHVAVAGGRLDPTLELGVAIENTSDRPLRVRVGVEWALTLLGGGGNPEAWWAIAGQRTPHDGAANATGIDVIEQGNDWLGVRLRTTLDQPGEAWYAPIETVSNSEAGFERVYQGSALLLSWLVDIPPGGLWERTILHEAHVALDQAAAELENPSARGLRATG